MRDGRAARVEKAPHAAPLVDWEIGRAANRLALPDPDADLAALPLAPLPPIDAVAARKRELEAEFAPAGLDGAAMAVDRLFVIKKPSGHVIEHKVQFQQAMIGALARYSMAVLAEALREINDSPEEWVPVAGVMVQACEKQVAWRRDELRAIDRMEAERRRRRHVEAEAGRRRRELERYLCVLAARAAEVHGDQAPSAGDIELAMSLRPFLRCPYGAMARTRWADCLGAPWGPRLCRQLALVARLKQACENGQCHPERAMAIARRVVKDEASTRYEIEQIEACAPGDAADAAKSAAETMEAEPMQADINMARRLSGLPPLIDLNVCEPNFEDSIAMIEAAAGLYGPPPSTRSEPPLEPETAPQRLGLDDAPRSAGSEPPRERDVAPRRFGKVLATLQGFRLPEENDPGVRRWLREMGVKVEHPLPTTSTSTTTTARSGRARPSPRRCRPRSPPRGECPPI